MDPSDATSADGFLPLSSATAKAVGPGPLRHVASTGSTNTDLADEARAGDSSGTVLVTDHQTAGRGRLDRVWEDVPGDALLVSFRIPTPATGAGGVVRALGAAARAAVDGLCRDRVLAKWPNDLVVVDGAAPGKLAGLLAEFVGGDTPCVVVGIGINIRPVADLPGATSMVECGGPDDRDRVLAALLEELGPRLADGSGVLDDLRTHSATIGSRVRVEMPDGIELRGDAVDLTADGELVVQSDDGVDHVVSTGDVVHLRSA
ncbi:MAG: biotin--[acetyl-CoA-carboxylase] ligase [Acidimicrobiales bacterium]